LAESKISLIVETNEKPTFNPTLSNVEATGYLTFNPEIFREVHRLPPAKTGLPDCRTAGLPDLRRQRQHLIR
jgi:UTP-glucose-1-phosphate uridylyltransferase